MTISSSDVRSFAAFQPKVDDPEQFGILQGRLGPLDADELVLGYVVLPENIALHQRLDLYWNDRQTTVVFQP